MSFFSFLALLTRSAPNGPAEQAVLIEACRKSGIMALDVDVVECHGSGRFIADAVEVASCGRALRDGAEAGSEAEMPLGQGFRRFQKLRHIYNIDHIQLYICII